MRKLLKMPAVRAVCFVLLAALLLMYTDTVLMDTDGSSMPFYAEPENTVDAVFLGSSLFCTGIDPVQMYRDEGFTGYVLYNWSQTPWAAYHYAKEALKTQSPRVLVVEANMFLYGAQPAEIDAATNSVSNENALKIPGSANRAALALAMHRWQTDRPSLESLASLYRSHANWQGFEGQDLARFYRRQAPATAKGYGPLYVTESFAAPAAPAPPQQLPALYEGSLHYLEKFYELSRRTGIALEFVAIPNTEYTEESYASLAAVLDWCSRHELPVTDLTRTEVQYASGFDFRQDMADYCHLNYRGARKLSALLGEGLQERHDLPDRREDAAYAHWDEAVVRNALDEQDAEVRIAATLPQLMEKTAGERYLTFIYAVGDMTAADAGQLREFFIEKHISSDVFDSTDAARLWVWWDNAVYETGAFEIGSAGGRISAAPGTVTVAGEEHSYAREGVNAVVIEKATGRWVQTITWATEHGYEPYTR